MVLTATTVVALSCYVASGEDAQSSCEALKSFHDSASKVLSAEYKKAGPFSLPSMGLIPRRQIDLPAHCVVRMTTVTSPDSSVATEIWLPEAAEWNSKLLGTGNGGYSSSLSLPQMAEGLRTGYAVGGSDTGHQGEGLDFGTGHPEKIRDWAYRSTHVLAENEKKIVTAFYGKPEEHAYFVGCSTGGQQALSEAQRYPRDFDGIVAGDPGNDRILLNADFVESWLTTHPADGAVFPAAKLPLVNKAVIAACDKDDGVADGIIGEPDKCTFDPETLACSGSVSSNTCLTDPEIKMVRRLYDGPVRNAAGKPMYAGWTRGSEAGWGAYLVTPSKPVRVEFWSDWVYGQNGFDLRAFNAQLAVSAARTRLPFVDAVNPDLRAFQTAGGKLLLYHGWADPVVPPEDTIGYYRQVEKSLGSSTENSVRLFLVPGMGHCGGGPGASTFDSLQALDAWVMNGTAPDSIDASHVEAGKATMTRPLCAFPKVARWDGHGDTSQESSYHCALGR
jgi:feruloyl esterase